MMKDRRTFFKQLALGIAALSAPSIFIPKLIERPKWKSEITSIVTTWNEGDLNLYHKLPWYLANCQLNLELEQNWTTWQRFAKDQDFINVYPDRIGQEFLNDGIMI